MAFGGKFGENLLRTLRLELAKRFFPIDFGCFYGDFFAKLDQLWRDVWRGISSVYWKMNSLKHSPNLTPLARNFGENSHDSLRLELAKTFTKLNTFGEKINLFGENFKNFGEKFGEELTWSFAVGTRQSIRQAFSSLARIYFVLWGRSSPKGFIKIFILNSVVFLWRKNINELSESLIILITRKFYSFIFFSDFR